MNTYEICPRNLPDGGHFMKPSALGVVHCCYCGKADDRPKPIARVLTLSEAKGGAVPDLAATTPPVRATLDRHRRGGAR